MKVYLMKSHKSYVHCTEQKKSLKKCITIQWIQWKYNAKMNAIFMNFKNSKISDPYRLSLNLTDKIDLKEKINILLYQILAFTIHRKI